MEHTIEGKKFCITGKLEHYTRTTAQRAIMQAGGEIAKSVGPKTDFLVVGSRAGSKLTKARTLGIPVIEEADLEAFLAGAIVDVDEDVVVSGDASVRDLIGEARAALDGTPDSSTWTTVVELVNACAPDQLGALVDFLEPQIARWQVPPSARWRPSKGKNLVEDAPGGWVDGIPSGELRVAPWHWIVEMVNKHESPKYRLLRAVHTTGMRMTSTAAAAVLERESLENLRSYDVGDTKLTKTFWRKLRTLPSTRSLERFAFSHLDDKALEGVHGDHHLENLRELKIDLSYSTRDRALAGLLTSDLVTGLEALTIRGTIREDAMRALNDPTVLPNLDHLTLSGWYHDQVNGPMQAPLMQRLTTFSLQYYINLSHQQSREPLATRLTAAFDALTDGVLNGPRVFDLSQLEIYVDPDEQRHLPVALTEVARNWKIPGAIETIRFGKHYSKGLGTAFARRGVEATR
jgi:hypothetical protein